MKRLLLFLCLVSVCPNSPSAQSPIAGDPETVTLGSSPGRYKVET